MRKYWVRYRDRLDIQWEHWATVEPFLKRSAVHFGHTVDYISRVLIWRHLAHGDLDINAWSSIVSNLLRRHGRLGNDSEVCWGIYACIHLKIKIDDEIAKDIAMNCGALSVVALLHCIALKLVSKSIFKIALDRVDGESAKGQLWPLILEWKSRKWTYHKSIDIDDDLINSMAGSRYLSNVSLLLLGSILYILRLLKFLLIIFIGIDYHD